MHGLNYISLLLLVELNDVIIMLMRTVATVIGRAASLSQLQQSSLLRIVFLWECLVRSSDKELIILHISWTFAFRSKREEPGHFSNLSGCYFDLSFCNVYLRLAPDKKSSTIH
jgi:hypothetical protein